MLPTAERSYHEALAMMEQVNRSLLDGRLARMRIRYRTGRTAERLVLDGQALDRLAPDPAE